MSIINDMIKMDYFDYDSCRGTGPLKYKYILEKNKNS